MLDFGRGAGDRRNFRVVFEGPYADVAALAEELRQYGIANGARLHLADDGAGARLVRRREDFAFGTAAVASIQPYRLEVREPGR